MQREFMEYDVLVVGAGPAGLSSAIQYAKLCKENNKQPSICVIDKGSEVGAHILSGAVFEPRALNELFPNWKELDTPIKTAVTKDEFYILTKSSNIKLPTPKQMANHGNYIISLSNLCKWLAKQAENLGVEIYPGFAARELLIKDNGESNSIIAGVITGDMGISKSGKKKSTFQPGIELRAKQTIFAEGCRGSLSQILVNKFNLRENKSPQTYGLGIKEIWEIDSKNFKSGLVQHSIGWPLESNTYGGSFLYHYDNNLVSIGFVVGLDYQNPYLSPYEEFQRFKSHPFISKTLEGGKCISYGARTINEGGFQSLPKLTFPGGLLVGCAAGFLNVPKIKGSHLAMKTGMIAGESVFNLISNNSESNNIEPTEYTNNIQNSWVWDELYKVRNIRPSFNSGLLSGLIYSALDTYIFRGKAPWTFKNHSDHESTKPAKKFKEIKYNKPDGKITFDKMTSVSRANVFHEEDQPAHLTLKNQNTPIDINLKNYNSPETRYCPAGVYEIVQDNVGDNKLQINAQNCVHCKACDIKDPTQNIVWVTPEGGGGPNYSGM
jgi:electron-transferring-flavoprotein dehydrogenase